MAYFYWPVYKTKDEIIEERSKLLSDNGLGHLDILNIDQARKMFAENPDIDFGFISVSEIEKDLFGAECASNWMTVSKTMTGWLYDKSKSIKSPELDSDFIPFNNAELDPDFIPFHNEDVQFESNMNQLSHALAQVNSKYGFKEETK